MVTANKWDDEEDDEVKENWDDDDEEEASKASSAGDASQPKTSTEPKEPGAKTKKKKALKDKLLQKDLEMSRPRTKEEQLADKLERQRLQEESDLMLAKEAFGVSSNGVDSSTSLAAIQLATRADFEAFRKALTGKLSAYTRSPYYVPFLEELCRELATDLESDDIKKLDTVLTTIFNEKIRIAKVSVWFIVYKEGSNVFLNFQQASKGKKAKGKAASTIAVERDDDYSYNQSNTYDEFDDFI